MLVAWLAVAMVMLGLGGLGRLVSAPTPGLMGGPVWWGWGLGALLLTLYAVVVPGHLTLFLMGMAVLALLGYARRPPTRGEWLAVGQVTLLALPLVWAWGQNQVFMWDDFSHRLPSLMFVDRFDALPRHDLPESLSGFPSYPYALTMLGVAVGRLLGSYTELAVAMVNGALLVAFGLLLGPLVTGRREGWRTAAAGLLLVTVLCPVFNAEFVGSAYQDTTLGLAAGAVFILLLPLLRDERVPGWREAWVVGLTLALVTGLKQVGLVVAGLVVMVPGLLLAWRLRGEPRRVALLSALVLGPVAVIWLAWRQYVAVNIGGGEFSFLPFAQWQWGLWPQMLGALGENLIEKPFVMAPLLIVSGLAGLAWRGGRFAELRWVLLVACAAGWGYFAFLLVTYVGSFSAYEAGKLASLSRYMQHVNWVLWVAMVLAGREVLGPWLARRAWVGRVAPLLLVIPVLIPQEFIGVANDEAVQMRALARVLPTLVPPGQGLEVRVDEAEGSGFRAHVLRYYVGYDYRVVLGVTRFGAAPDVTNDAVVNAGPDGVTVSRCHAGVCGPAVRVP